MADGGNYIPFSGHPQTAFQWAHPRPAVQSHSVLTILDQHTSVMVKVYIFCAEDTTGRGLRPRVPGLSLKVRLRATDRRRETARIFSRWSSFFE
jgi:hypothetical protein